MSDFDDIGFQYKFTRDRTPSPRPKAMSNMSTSSVGSATMIPNTNMTGTQGQQAQRRFSNGMPSTIPAEKLPANLQVNSNPLFSFDLNFDSLKTFLDKTTSTINQHAELINALQQELSTRETKKVLPEQLAIISEAGKIMDNNLANTVKNQIAKSVRPENTGDNLANQTNKIYNKLTALGYAAAYNFNSNLEFPARFVQIEKDIAKKAVKDEVKEKHKKLKQRVATDIEEIKKYFEKKMIDMDNKYAEKINQFEDKAQSIEKKTLWRIQDCEEMIKKRITEGYVDDSIKALEDKIRREVITLAQSDAEKIERLSTEIITKMKMMEDTQAEKLKQVKKQIKDLEDYTCTKLPLFEDFKKVTNANIQELQKKQKELEKSQDLMPIVERQNVRIKAIDDKLNDIQNNFQQRFQDLMNHVTNSSGTQNKKGEIVPMPSNLDPHKLCQIEADLNRAVEDLKKQQMDIDEIKNQVLIKLQNIDLSVYEAGMQNHNNRPIQVSGGNGGQGMQDLIEQFRQQMNEIRERMGSADDEKIKKLQSDVKEISKKMETMRDLEKRLQRIFKEFDISTMAKQLKQKAESDDVLKDFTIMDTKVNTNTDQIGYCRKDIDNLILLYKKLLQALQQNTQHGDINSIITTKKLTPFNQLGACLSCGIPKNNLQTTYPGRGTDGKNYKVDLTITNDNTSFAESKNMFHYASTPSMPQSTKLQRPATAQVRNESQNQQQQQMSISGVQQNRNTLQVNNSSNSRRMLRPESAKK